MVSLPNDAMIKTHRFCPPHPRRNTPRLTPLSALTSTSQPHSSDIIPTRTYTPPDHAHPIAHPPSSHPRTHINIPLANHHPPHPTPTPSYQPTHLRSPALRLTTTTPNHTAPLTTSLSLCVTSSYTPLAHHAPYNHTTTSSQHLSRKQLQPL